jgi:hypothetical protein
LGLQLPKKEAFDVGEWFKFRIHYGFINAGYATLEVKKPQKTIKSISRYRKRIYNRNVTFFFKVDDTYESYFDKETNKPYQFVRKIDEGGYTKNQEGFFNQDANKVLVKDYKNKKKKLFRFQKTSKTYSQLFTI